MRQLSSRLSQEFQEALTHCVEVVPSFAAIYGTRRRDRQSSYARRSKSSSFQKVSTAGESRGDHVQLICAKNLGLKICLAGLVEVVALEEMESTRPIVGKWTTLFER
jgi:hypothetical protein